MLNWDNPYRDADEGIHGNLQRLGPDCAYIAIDPFPNDTPESIENSYDTTDRKYFPVHQQRACSIAVVSGFDFKT